MKGCSEKCVKCYKAEYWGCCIYCPDIFMDKQVCENSCATVRSNIKLAVDLIMKAISREEVKV